MQVKYKIDKKIKKTKMITEYIEIWRIKRCNKTGYWI